MNSQLPLQEALEPAAFDQLWDRSLAAWAEARSGQHRKVVLRSRIAWIVVLAGLPLVLWWLVSIDTQGFYVFLWSLVYLAVFGGIASALRASSAATGKEHLRRAICDHLGLEIDEEGQDTDVDELRQLGLFDDFSNPETPIRMSLNGTIEGAPIQLALLKLAKLSGRRVRGDSQRFSTEVFAGVLARVTPSGGFPSRGFLTKLPHEVERVIAKGYREIGLTEDLSAGGWHLLVDDRAGGAHGATEEAARVASKEPVELMKALEELARFFRIHRCRAAWNERSFFLAVESGASPIDAQLVPWSASDRERFESMVAETRVLYGVLEAAREFASRT